MERGQTVKQLREAKIAKEAAAGGSRDVKQEEVELEHATLWGQIQNLRLACKTIEPSPPLATLSAYTQLCVYAQIKGSVVLDMKTTKK